MENTDKADDLRAQKAPVPQPDMIMPAMPPLALLDALEKAVRRGWRHLRHHKEQGHGRYPLHKA